MEFHPCHNTAFILAGTVALPSPYPAWGAVSIVVKRDGDDDDFTVFIKILQVVSERRIITRFVRPEDIRAIRADPDGKIGHGPVSWPVHDIKKLRAELDRRSKELHARARTGILEEHPWYPSAIVYVLESAPVLHRDEAGVTAAVSAEDVGFGNAWSGCCHVASVFDPDASFCCHIAPTPHPQGRRAAEGGG